MNFAEGSWLSTIPHYFWQLSFVQSLESGAPNIFASKASKQFGELWACSIGVFVYQKVFQNVCYTTISYNIYVDILWYLHDLLPSLSKCPVHCGIKLLSMIIQLLYKVFAVHASTLIFLLKRIFPPPIFEAKKGNNRLGGPNYPHRKKLHLTRHWLEQKLQQKQLQCKEFTQKNRQAKRNFRGRTLRKI